LWLVKSNEPPRHKDTKRIRSRFNHEDKKAQRGAIEVRTVNHQDTKTQRKSIVVGLDHSSSLVDDAMFLVCF
jgi:hypothetical protein